MSDKEKEQELENRKESCKTYLEQTKLLITLASAFLIAPAFIFTVSEDNSLTFLFWAEGSFVLSVLFGYVVFGTISGSQRDGEYDVYRPATRNFSFMQLAVFLAGMIFFVVMFVNLEIKQENFAPKECQPTSQKECQPTSQNI